MKTNNKKQELERDFKNTLSGFFEALVEFKEACDRFETRGKELKAQIHKEDTKEIQKLIGKTIVGGWDVERIDAINLREDTFEKLLLPRKYLYVDLETTNIVNGSTYSRVFCTEDLIELLNGGESRGYTLLKEEDTDKRLKEIKEAKEQDEERLRPIKAKRQRLYDFAKELLVGKTIADHGIFAVEVLENPSYARQKYREYETIEHIIEDVVETDGPPCWSDWGSPDGKQITIKCSGGLDYFLRTRGFNRTLIDLVRGESIEMGGFPCNLVWVKEYKLCPLIRISPNGYSDGYNWYGFDTDELIENMKIVLNQGGMKLRWENEELKRKIEELEKKNETANLS